VADTLTALAAVASATSRIRLGPMVAPPARYGPQRLARAFRHPWTSSRPAASPSASVSATTGGESCAASANPRIPGAGRSPGRGGRAPGRPLVGRGGLTSRPPLRRRPGAIPSGARAAPPDPALVRRPGGRPATRATGGPLRGSVPGRRRSRPARQDAGRGWRRARQPWMASMSPCRSLRAATPNPTRPGVPPGSSRDSSRTTSVKGVRARVEAVRDVATCRDRRTQVLRSVRVVQAPMWMRSPSATGTPCWCRWGRCCR